MTYLFIIGQNLTSQPQYDICEHLKVELLEEQTEAEVEALLKTKQSSRRVMREGAAFKVDRVFRVSYVKETQETALNYWQRLHKQLSWMLGIDAGLAVGGFSVVRSQPPIDTWLASFSVLIGSLASLGAVGASYLSAGKQLQAWQAPATDFARRRIEALQLPLPEIFQQHCRFSKDQKKGTLTDLEIWVLWKKAFNNFAERLLKLDLQEKQEWLSQFYQDNPLLTHYFKDDLEILQGSYWTEIREIQTEITQLNVDEYQKIREVLEKALLLTVAKPGKN